MTCRRSLRMFVFAVGAAIVATSTLWAGGERSKPAKARDVTLVGKVVDLQSYMSDKFAGGDPAKSTQDCIRQGVPAALETNDGLVVLGMGERGPSRTLLPLAQKRAEVKGKLYEKDGLQYLDMISAKPVKEEGEEGEEDKGGDEGADEEP
jgi:hypothetical protein